MSDVFDSAVSMGARMLQANLRRQAPVDTGALRNSIKVRGRMIGDRINFNVEYLGYGKFVDLGTGPYRARQRRTWNPRPGRGKGGIKPRFWLTFNKQVFDAVRKRIAQAVGKFIILGIKR